MVKVVAHRGYHQNGIRENTVDAIIAAEELNCDSVEFDVHLTSDDRWVLYHDDELEETDQLVEEMTLDEILAFGTEKNIVINSLDEVLSKTTIHLNVECKTEGIEAGKKLAEMMKDRDSVISSFHSSVLEGIREVSDEQDIAILADTTDESNWKELHDQFGLFSANIRGDGIQPADIQRIKQKGIEVHLWTINEVEHLQLALQFGMDAIITDRPDRLKEILEQS